MKTRLLKRISTLAAGALALGLAVILPIQSAAAAAVKLESSLSVANVTTGTQYNTTGVNAKYNEVVKVQLMYHNTELPDSNKIAENVRAKFSVPTTPGKNQVITSTIGGTNTNSLSNSVKVTLDRDDAYLQYIPGSAIWKHNVGGRAASEQNIVETKVSDDIVMGGTGIVLENQKPCFEYAASVTILVRVMVPGVKIVKESQVSGQTNKWSNDNTAKPGDTMDYKITYQNTGNTVHNNVLIRDSLPPSMSLVPGSTKIYANIPGYENGKAADSDALTSGGIYIGSYTAGSGAYITFKAKIKDASALQCGTTTMRNIAVAKPEGFQEHYNVAVTKVTKDCTETKVPVCDSLSAVVDNKTKKVTFTLTVTNNGATFKQAVYNFGDNSNTLTTDKKTVNHTYTGNGPFTASARVTFAVNGKDTVVTSPNCEVKVSFTDKPVVPPVTPPVQPPTLPETGSGSVVAIVAGISALAAGAHYFIRRRSAN